jgi:2-polyprenyl-3-methyl-5-hydroxy-6-metoxy-1,4-benzoquinol methylase
MTTAASLRDQFERLHASLRDGELDVIARIAGCDPEIGRLNYLDDATLERLIERLGIHGQTRVLDFGCGRGFLGRWLHARGIEAAYTGIDASASALDAVSRSLPRAAAVLSSGIDVGGVYDAIVCIESVWAVDSELARAMQQRLSPGGRIAFVLTSLDSSHAARLEATIAALAAAGFDAEITDVSASCVETAGRLSAAMLIEGFQDAWVRERLSAEARHTLAAIRDGGFRSSIVFATRT